MRLLRSVLAPTLGTLIALACGGEDEPMACRDPGQPTANACSGFQPSGSSLVLSESSATMELDGRIRLELTQSGVDSSTTWTVYVDPCAVDSIPVEVELDQGVDGMASCEETGTTGGAGEIVGGRVRVERLRDGCIAGRLVGLRVDECGLIDGGFELVLESVG